ncbi:MAG: 4-phosphoerythronate dehydrogenase [Paludibacteraceae bacterium]|nr:4-phosphoerythronate dehydrogenase [Paludibacteraceae bacterium]
MKIVCDRHIPYFVDAIRSGWPDVDICPMETDEIAISVLTDADVLVVRTRTHVDAALLEGTNIRLVCTATIGYDHIDADYCETHGVRWMSCPGCNAQAVCDYVEEAISHQPSAVSFQNSEVRSQMTIGVVGVGHIGSLVAKMAERKGMNVLLNDPPRGIGVTLDEIAHRCDIITFHTPLNQSTYHLCGADFLSKTKVNALIINAARGGVADETALLESGRPYILDTWENEPHINTVVAKKARLASMHIAGYSVEGKVNASQMCLDAIAEQFGMPKLKIAVPATRGDSQPGWLKRVSEVLQAHPDQFEQLRKAYVLR